MITQIEVNGFRSLDDFKLLLNPGLNILVGPNGSGKTNIVLFFEFLAHIVESDLSEATGFLGGSGAILRREKETHTGTMNARVLGCYPIDSDEAPIQIDPSLLKDGKFMFYEYSFTAMFTQEIEPVIFLKQDLRLKFTNKFIEHSRIETEATNWDFEAESAHLPRSTSPTSFKIKKATKKISPLIPFFGNKAEQDHAKQLEEILSGWMGTNNSLPNVITRFSPMMHLLSKDIAGGQAFNIIPSKVRAPEDGARPPGIAHDGSGLASTLLALKRRTSATNTFLLFQNLTPGRHVGIRLQPMERILSYFQLAYKSVRDIQVFLDSYSNQIRVQFDVNNGDYSAKIPLSLMSDGTLKWLTLITAALTSASVFSIEEPENYLHPKMQAHCVNLLRDILFQKRPYQACIMTTHSETLLNQCKPEELVIVNFVNGKTIAYRCQNEAEISDEIAKTGFGLGYFYITNALDNE